MNLLHHAIDLFLHLDKHLTELTAQYGGWTYAILFLVIFCETGLVVTPFLPGDSLLFAAGALAALGSLDPLLLFLILALAAILGDTANYWIGHVFGHRLVARKTRWIKQEHLDRTHQFYERYGGKTIILARFVPIVRTFAPFVAGLGSMRYRYFLACNVIGGLLWVGLFTFGGYFFGNLPPVRDHFSFVIIGIIAVSLLPIAIEYVRHRKQQAQRPATARRESATQLPPVE
jgi:membrane-associated protein